MTPHTPKSELKRRSYDLDKLAKVFCRTAENYVATKFSVATDAATWFFAATEQTMSRHRKLCRDIENYVAT